MALFCPNLNDPKTKAEFEELVSAFNEDKAYYLWSANNGYHLDKTPDGNNSILFEKLVNEAKGDRIEALKLKSKIYTKAFMNWFGDWRNHEGSVVVDKHGEPMIVYHGSMLEEKDGEFTVFDIEKANRKAGFFFTPNKGYAKFVSLGGIRLYEPDETTIKSYVVSAYLNVRKPFYMGVPVDTRTVADVKEGLKNQGFERDGFFGDERGMNDPQTKEPIQAIVVLESNQIKSIHNNGQFSIDPDISKAIFFKWHDDPKIQADIDRYGDLIHNGNNSYIWPIEKEFNLVKWTTKNGVRSKIANDFNYKSATKTAAEVRKYIKDNNEDWQLYTVRVEKVLRWVNGKSVVRYAIKVYKDIGRDLNGNSLSHISIAGIEHTVRLQDTMPLVSIVNTLRSKETNIVDTLTKLYETYPKLFAQRPDLKHLYSLVLKNADKLSNVDIKLFTPSEELDDSINNPGNQTYMYYGFDDTIYINGATVTTNPTLEGFIEGLLHETMHAFTERALTAPQDAVDERFQAKVTQVYTEARKALYGAKNASELPYGFKNEKEFLSVFMTSPVFAEQLKGLKDNNFFGRLIDAITQLLYRLTGIDVRRSDLYDKTYNLMVDFINHQTKFGVNDLGYIGPEYETSYAKVKYTDKQVIERAREIASRGTKDAIAEALKYIDKHITLTKDSHTYQTQNGLTYRSVHEFMSEYGYGYDGKPTERGKRSMDIGTAIHLTIENDIGNATNNVLKETGFKLSREAKKDLAKTLDQFKGKNVTILSEVKIFDPDKQIAGTIDMAIIDEKTRVMLFDFKTRESGFRYYDNPYNPRKDPRNKGKNVPNITYPSVQEMSRLQLSTYKHMIEKLIGKKVTSMNVVMLMPEVTEDDVISRVHVDTSYDETGMDTFFNEVDALERMYGEPQKKFGRRRKILTEEARIEAEKSFFDTSQFSSAVQLNTTLSHLDRILADIRVVLERRLEISKKRYSFTRRKSFEDFMKDLNETESHIESLIKIVQYANRTTNQLYKRFQDKVKSGGDMTIAELGLWKDYVSVYNILDDLQALLTGSENIFKDPSLIKLLDDTILKRNKIQSLYKTYGIEMLSKFLTPYYNGIRNKIKGKIEADYRRQAHRLRKKGYKPAQIIDEIGTMNAFVTKELESRKDSLDEETEKLIQQELHKASGDVSYLTRWLDNMLDTTDVVASAVVNAFDRAEQESRQRAYEKRKELVDAVRELEKSMGKGLFQSPEEFYGFMLERDKDGKLTQHILKPWKSELRAEERKVRTDAYASLTTKEAEAKIRRWRNDNMILDKTAYREALSSLFTQMHNEGRVTDRELELLNDYVLSGRNTIQNLTSQGFLNEEAADDIMGWITENRYYYYSYKKKWLNPQWSAFVAEFGIDPTLPYYEQMKAIKKSTNKKAKFYSLIDEIAHEANQLLPYNYRIAHRLPGVPKSFYERATSGQNVMTILKNTAERDFFIRPEDTERGNFEYTDEEGRPKYFLPIHYTARLEPENQSYDLAGIYFRFWASSIDYAIKKEILPEIEMARYFINNRKTVERDVFGNVVKKIKQGVLSTAEDQPDTEEPKTKPSVKDRSNMAEMFNDWFNMAVYGKKSTDKTLIPMFGGKKVFDFNKFIDNINAYTSLNLLAFNAVQGIANVTIGETMEAIEAIAGEYVSTKTFTKATLAYTAMLPKKLAQVGDRYQTDKLSLLEELFDVLDETPLYTDFFQNTKVRQLMNSNTLFFMQHAGEHWMQMRFLIARLMEKKAYDKNGKLLGNMFDQYIVNDKGELALKKEVDQVQSGWTAKDIEDFRRQTKGILSRMHGEYSDLGRVAIQRLAIGRMAYMFRKFIVPGFRRRWGKSRYIERLGQTVEGNYITFGRVAPKLIKDIVGFKLAVLSEDWAALSTHEKANIYRTTAEIAFLVAAYIIGAAALRLKNEDPDDDRFWSLMAYQAYRLKSELLFFTPKLDETMSILRSPMAAMSVLENTTRLISQMFHPWQTYQRGPWKGHLKLEKDVVMMIPLYKQYFRWRDIGQQIQWFKSTPGMSTQ